MEWFFFVMGWGFGAVLMLLVQQRALYRCRVALDDAHDEIALLKKKIQLQNGIYERLEHHLIMQFSQFRQPEPPDEPMMDDDEPNPYRRTWRIGNTVYFDYETYVEALERGELERLGGYLV